MRYRSRILLVTFVLFFLFSAFVGAEETKGEEHYTFAVNYYANYAMIDDNGSIIGEPQYEDAREFSEGLAAVRKNGKWGYIDRDGKVVIDYQFDIARSFHCGRAVVGWFLDIGRMGDNEDLAVIDKQGKYIVPQGKHFFISDFSCDRALIDWETKYIDIDGKVVIDGTGSFRSTCQFSEDLACVEKRNGDSVVIDKWGNELFTFCSWSYADYFEAHFSCGLLPAYILDEKKYGYLDKTGKTALVLDIGERPGYFSEGFATIWVSEPGEDEDEYIIIDKQGKKYFSVSEGNFIGSFSDGLALYREGEKFGFCNEEGVVFPAKWEDIMNFHEGIAWVSGVDYVRAMRRDGSFLPLGRMVSSDDAFALDYSYNFESYLCLPDFSEGRSFVPLECAIVSSKNPEKHIAYLNTGGYLGFLEGLIPCSERGENAPSYFTEDGKAIIRGNYNDCGPFNNGKALIYGGSYEDDRKAMIIDRDGKTIELKDTPSCDIPHCDRIVVYEKDKGDDAKYGIVDTNGNQILPCSYHSIDWRFENNFVHAQKTEDSPRVILNRDGKVATEEELSHIQAPKEIRGKYYNIEFFSVGLAAFQLVEGGDYGFIDKQGKVIIEPQFEYVVETSYNFAGCFSGGLAVVKKGGFYGFIDKQGNTIVPFKYDEIGLDGEDLPSRIAFKGEYCAVKLNGKWGFVNRKGEEVIKPQYDHLMNYNHDIAVVAIEKSENNYVFGVIHIKDKSELLPFKYSRILWQLR